MADAATGVYVISVTPSYWLNALQDPSAAVAALTKGTDGRQSVFLSESAATTHRIAAALSEKRLDPKTFRYVEVLQVDVSAVGIVVEYEYGDTKLHDVNLRHHNFLLDAPKATQLVRRVAGSLGGEGPARIDKTDLRKIARAIHANEHWLPADHWLLK